MKKILKSDKLMENSYISRKMREICNFIKKNGDLVIIGKKSAGKTTLLQHLTRDLMAIQGNRIVIFETFPKWIHEFDSIPYMVITENYIKEKAEFAEISPNELYINWNKDFRIQHIKTINEFLKNKHCLFLIDCDDMEKISVFMSYIIYKVYRKQYKRAKENTLNTIDENYYFIVEEAHNLLDSSIINKKAFNKLRKMQNEFRNLKMHLICVACRLQDLNPKIRSKMSVIFGAVSLDDYQLKIRTFLKYNRFQKRVLELPTGSFVIPELNSEIRVKPFKQKGKPIET